VILAKISHASVYVKYDFVKVLGKKSNIAGFVVLNEGLEKRAWNLLLFVIRYSRNTDISQSED